MVKKILITAWSVFLLAAVAITIVQSTIGMTPENFDFAVGMTAFWFVLCSILTFSLPVLINE